MNSIMMECCSKLLALVCTLLLAAPVHVDSYSIFGTKRFQRNNNVQQIPQAAAAFVAQAPVQIFTPIQTGVASQFDPMDGYYADDPNNYLYYAPHDPQYHTYGMKVYQGDYKPAPYYYAPGPTYQYYDDKEANNPLDDLHEEMLEEDEREQQQLRLQQQQQQRLRQYGQQHRQQAIRDDYPDFAKHRNYYQPIYESAGTQGQEDFDYGGVEDASVGVGDPSYAQANAAFLNNLIQYNRQMTKSRGNKNVNSHFDVLKAHNQIGQPSRSEYNSNWNVDYPLLGDDNAEDEDYPAYPQMNNRPRVHAGEEDKAVRELQQLTHSRDKASSSALRKSAQPMISSAQFDDYLGDGGAVSNMDKNSEFANQYDYDDGGDEWINWDSKRSGGVGIIKPASVVAYTERKPSKIVITKVPENHFVLEQNSQENAPSTSSNAEQGAAAKAVTEPTRTSGQKEEVLMRPAPPVRHPFSAPVLKMLENQESMKANKQASEDLANQKRSEGTATPPKVTVYDTIKQLLEMEQNLKSSGAAANVPRFVSRLQKRFVADEGSLVKQLESLKKIKV